MLRFFFSDNRWWILFMPASFSTSFGSAGNQKNWILLYECGGVWDTRLRGYRFCQNVGPRFLKAQDLGFSMVCYNQNVKLTHLEIHCSINLTYRTSRNKTELSETSKMLWIGAIATKLEPKPCGCYDRMLYAKFHNSCISYFLITENCDR